MCLQLCEKDLNTNDATPLGTKESAEFGDSGSGSGKIYIDYEGSDIK